MIPKSVLNFFNGTIKNACSTKYSCDINICVKCPFLNKKNKNYICSLFNSFNLRTPEEARKEVIKKFPTLLFLKTKKVKKCTQ